MRRAARALAAWLTFVAIAVGLGFFSGCGGSTLPQVHDEAGRLDLARRLYAKGDYGLAVEALGPFSTSGMGAGTWTRPSTCSGSAISRCGSSARRRPTSSA